MFKDIFQSRYVLITSMVLAIFFSSLSVAVSAQDKSNSPKLGDRLPGPAVLPAKESPGKNEPFPDIPWEALSPKDWDPFASIRDLNFATLKDSDPRAMEALQKMTAARNNAPVVPEMKGRSIKISGFLVPLTKVKDEVIDFLLVPYFGACIHTPPPPSNMVIMVVPEKPFKGGSTMDAVTVSGTLSIERTDSPWGTAGYRLAASRVTKYVAPKAKSP